MGDNMSYNFFKTTDFTYHAGTFSAEASELFNTKNGRHGYPVSFCIENPATNVCVWYDLDKLIRDRDGDIEQWNYLPKCSYNGIGIEVALSDKVKKTKVVVFND